MSDPTSLNFFNQFNNYQAQSSLAKTTYAFSSNADKAAKLKADLSTGSITYAYNPDGSTTVTMQSGSALKWNFNLPANVPFGCMRIPVSCAAGMPAFYIGLSDATAANDMWAMCPVGGLVGATPTTTGRFVKQVAGSFTDSLQNFVGPTFDAYYGTKINIDLIWNRSFVAVAVNDVIQGVFDYKSVFDITTNSVLANFAANISINYGSTTPFTIGPVQISLPGWTGLQDPKMVKNIDHSLFTVSVGGRQLPVQIWDAGGWGLATSPTIMTNWRAVRGIAFAVDPVNQNMTELAQFFVNTGTVTYGATNVSVKWDGTDFRVLALNDIADGETYLSTQGSYPSISFSGINILAGQSSIVLPSPLTSIYDADATFGIDGNWYIGGTTGTTGTNGSAATLLKGNATWIGSLTVAWHDTSEFHEGCNIYRMAGQDFPIFQGVFEGEARIDVYNMAGTNLGVMESYPYVSSYVNYHPCIFEYQGSLWETIFDENDIAGKWSHGSVTFHRCVNQGPLSGPIFTGGIGLGL